MGLILDSSVLIASERKGQNAHQALAEIAVHAAGEDVAMSVVTVIELAHGVPAPTRSKKSHEAPVPKRTDDRSAGPPGHRSGGSKAGQIDGENTALGVPVALPDLLIGVTALELDYRVATANVRHFQMVPGLGIVCL